MIVYAKGISSLKEYEKDKARQEASPPAECPRCRLADVFWRHGSYLRQVREWAEKAAVKIYRYICKECSLTLSCLYGFVVAYRRCSAKMVTEATEGYATEPASYRELAWSKESEASSSSIVDGSIEPHKTGGEGFAHINVSSCIVSCVYKNHRAVL